MILSRAEVLMSPNGIHGVDESNPLLPAAATAVLTSEDETLGNGGVRHHYHATLTVDPQQANPFPGADATLVVRVMGAPVMWPVVMDGLVISVDENATTAEDFVTVQDGVGPYAVANPIYLDLNGDGRFKGAFEP